ncbi:MAG: hypothetical protein EPN37_05400 [Chitinophagaceae bacterium]|nr:MAG: hypothetical protein EPN37_05400 [Chitinophagaceae bacterium]
MKTIVLSLGVIAFTFCATSAWSQQVTYSMPQRNDDYRNTSVEIIGKVENNILVYKNNRGDNTISIYDENMRLVKNVPLQFLPDRVLNVDFAAYPDHFQMIYQFQHKAYVYCYGVLMDQDANVVGQPLLIDSSRVGFGNVRAKIYSVIHSDNGQRVLIYKINQDNDYNNVFYTFLFDPQLNLVNNSRLTLSMRENRSFLSNFLLSNDGHFAFVRVARAGANGNLSNAALVIKPPMTDSFMVHPLNLQGKYLDEMKLKLDNMNNKIFIASFYTLQRRGSIAGLYAGEYNWNGGAFDDLKFIPFSDNLKMDAKDNSSLNNAFNNFFIRQLVVRGDGGFLLTAESYYTTQGNQPWNRWNYMYSPWGFSPYYYPYYYSPFSPFYYNPFYWNNYQGTQYHYNDVAILSYGADGKLEWSNFIRKQQSDDNSDAFLSYRMVNIASALQFIYNEPFRRSYLITVMSVTPDGKLTKLPTLRGLDQGYQWMPRYGKQISSRQVVIPCIYRNSVCFAKIDF